jgi:hypothetical protein
MLVVALGSCNAVEDGPSTEPPETSTTIVIVIPVEELFDIEKCGRAHRGRVALAEVAGVPNNSLLTDWIRDHRDQYETWCAENYVDLFGRNFRESEALQELTESRFDAADRLVQRTDW